MLAVTELASHIGMQAACRAFAFNPGFVYRDRAKGREVSTPQRVSARARPPLAFSIANPSYFGSTHSMKIVSERGLITPVLDQERILT
jgi:hypothetical protein